MGNRKASVPKPNRKTNAPPEKGQLSRDTWLDGAAAAIAEGGFDNVRVLTLAKKLGVTRGSFYWHFHDHADLLVSFLSRWRDRRLRELAYLRPSDGDTETELRRILRLVLSEQARNSNRMKVELAVRDFARRDAYAAKMVAEVDRARVAQTASWLENVTADKRMARELALLFYVATIGGRVVLIGSREGKAAIERIEGLITEIVMMKARAV